MHSQDLGPLEVDEIWVHDMSWQSPEHSTPDPEMHPRDAPIWQRYFRTVVNRHELGTSDTQTGTGIYSICLRK